MVLLDLLEGVDAGDMIGRIEAHGETVLSRCACSPGLNDSLPINHRTRYAVKRIRQ
jgi:hypothetical protein